MVSKTLRPCSAADHFGASKFALRTLRRAEIHSVKEIVPFASASISWNRSTSLRIGFWTDTSGIFRRQMEHKSALLALKSPGSITTDSSHPLGNPGGQPKLCLHMLTDAISMLISDFLTRESRGSTVTTSYTIAENAWRSDFLWRNGQQSFQCMTCQKVHTKELLDCQTQKPLHGHWCGLGYLTCLVRSPMNCHFQAWQASENGWWQAIQSRS